MMDIKIELLANLDRINMQLGLAVREDTRANLLIAKAETLKALQKYEVGGIVD
jgi:hypothetical protein